MKARVGAHVVIPIVRSLLWQLVSELSLSI